MDPYAAQHDEVAEALKAIGDPAFGERVRLDRGSSLEHLGISIPALRKRVAGGFSFTSHPHEEVLATWDALWRSSPYGDVLLAALVYYGVEVRKSVDADIWPIINRWPARVDNWCHADMLSAVCSRIVEAYPAETLPQIADWSRAESEWHRRIAIVSLIHYSGRNAVFLTPRQVLPVLGNCLDDHRYYVQQAVGWVLREMFGVHPAELTDFIEMHASRIGARAFARAIERLPLAEKRRLQALRGRELGSGSGPATE